MTASSIQHLMDDEMSMDEKQVVKVLEDLLFVLQNIQMDFE